MTKSDLTRLAKQHAGRVPAELAGEALKALYRKRSKYGNRKVTLDGISFDSQSEAERYLELKMMQAAGQISELRVHVRIPLIGQNDMPIFYDSGRQAVYEADFVYLPAGSIRYVVEDRKGMDTPASKLKRAIVQSMYKREVLVTRATGRQARGRKG